MGITSASFAKAPFCRLRNKVSDLEEEELMGHQATVPRPDRLECIVSPGESLGLSKGQVNI